MGATLRLHLCYPRTASCSARLFPVLGSRVCVCCFALDVCCGPLGFRNLIWIRKSDFGGGGVTSAVGTLHLVFAAACTLNIADLHTTALPPPLPHCTRSGAVATSK